MSLSNAKGLTMRVLVTAGNTETPIDRVRVITNIFSGRTGAHIALEAYGRGHEVELMTSRPQPVTDIYKKEPAGARWAISTYRTFDDLAAILEQHVRERQFDVIVHAAAVSDYLVAGVFAPASGTSLDQEGRWQGKPPAFVDRSAGKVRSDEEELWLRLKRAPKLVDAFRSEWGFKGVLVKFKLEVGVDAARLIEIAEPSRIQSGADLMVANSLEGANDWALLGPVKGQYERASRTDLPARLWSEVELLHERRPRG
jgi:phosphopantothenoylcysteine synthetase/decarboxylase